VVGAVVVALLLAQTVPVEVEGEGAPSCPRPERVTALLAGRPGGAGVDAESAMWRLRYRQERSAGAVQMELIDPTGQVAARRQMQMAPSECEAGAVAMVAVVERFFRGVAWTSGAALPAVVTAAPPAPAGPASGRRLEVGLGVNGALWLADAVRPRVAIGVHIVTPTTVPARLGVQILLPPGSRVERLGGAATVSETVWPLRISAALASRTGPFTVWLGPDALFALGFGRSAGLPSLDSGTRLTAALGAAAALQLSLGRWQLVADLAAHRQLASKNFHVDAANGGRLPVLGSPIWQGLAALGLVRAF
jgi:hypothetical protein